MNKKLAIITGGARGIGLEIATELCSPDIYVVIVDVLDKELEKAKEYLETKSAFVSSYTLNIKDSRGIKKFFNYIYEEHGRVDILVNNAGISPKTEGKRVPTHLVTEEEWEEVFNVNMKGAFLFTKYSLPFMMDQSYGRIINISSVAGRAASRIAASHYAATKSGLIGFSRTVASEYGQYGITVNNIAPGRIETPMAFTARSEINKGFLQDIPLGKIGRPKDVAGAVKFLCSEDANYITGATIDVNGGIFMN